MIRLRVRLFGHFQVTWDEQPLEFHSSKVRALLAYLISEANRHHSRERLAALLWGEHEDREALTNLRNALSHLNRALTPLGPLADARGFVLSANRYTVALRLEPHPQLAIDLLEFNTLISACQAHRHQTMARCYLCLVRLTRAMDLYQDDFLAELAVPAAPAFDEWRGAQRGRFYHFALEALQILADHYAALRHIPDLQRYAQRLLDLEPWREETHRQVMFALASSGAPQAALTQYELCRHALRQELGVEPAPETQRLADAIRRGERPSLPSAPLYRLPAPTMPLVGYQAELAEVIESLWDPECRLLTVLGPGGAGKTRLSLEVAREVAGWTDFQDGVCFVSLEEVASPDQLCGAIAACLALPGAAPRMAPEELADALRGKQLLLILDGLEHLLAPEEGCSARRDAADLLLILLERLSTAKFLVTSRMPLHLRAEWRKRLSGLAYPVEDDSAQALEAWVLHYTAVELFVSLARRIDPSFAPSQVDLLAIKRICAAVQGLPLALEIAAAWLDRYTCAEIEREIRSSLDFLVSPLRDVSARHRSLRAAFEASWQLLSAEEQSVLADLTALDSGFTLATASAALATDRAGPPQAVVTSLVDKSLLRQVANTYHWHDLIRGFVRQKRRIRAEAET